MSSTASGANAGTISITGTGGSGTFGNAGVLVNGSTTAVTGVAGAISITGTAGAGSDNFNDGVHIEVDSVVQVTTGLLTVSGTAGAGNSHGVRLNEVNGGHLKSVGSGEIVVTADGNGTHADLIAGADSIIGGTTATGAITINADSIDLRGTLNVQSNGALAILPRTADTTIGIGGGSGTLNLDDTELQFLHEGFSSITIGDATSGTGAVDVDSSTFTDPVTIAGGSIEVTEIDAGANAVALTALTGTITDGGDAGTDVTGGAVMLAAANGTIGASGDAISLSGSSLVTNTDAANGNQDLAEAGSGVTIDVGGLSAGTGTIHFDAGTFSLGGSDRINDNTNINLNGGTLDLQSFDDAIGAVRLTAGEINGDGTLTTGGPIDARAGTVRAILAGNVGLEKTTTGRVTLHNANTFTGQTIVNAGTLLVTGALAAGVEVQSGGTLGGTGTVGGAVNVLGSGTVAPGLSPGVINTGDLHFLENSDFHIEIGGTTAGTLPDGYDQTKVTGTVILDANVTLSTVRFNTFTPVPGNTFTIIDNDGTDAVSGAFAGLPEGATIRDFVDSGRRAVITYTGGDGNDVVLTVGDGFIVDTASDANDVPGQLSLREAIVLANANPGADTITFASALHGQTITLNGTQLPTITDPLTITGPGANLLTIDANRRSRIFNIDDGTATQIAVTIAGVTFTGGNAAEGGAMSSREDLTLTNSALSGNHASNRGGGIFNDGSSGNATLTVTGSTFSDNQAGLGGGGGIFNGGDSGTATLTVDHSTFSRNQTLFDGGGIKIGDGVANITNSTLTANRADTGGDDDILPGGISTNNVNVTLHNTIVVGNFSGSGSTAGDLGGVVATASSFNLIGDASSAGGLTDGQNGNLVGNAGTDTIDVNLVLDRTLADNGGPTQTHALVSGSVAIDQGKDVVSGTARDQRGYARPVDDSTIVNPAGGDGSDIGAVEMPVQGTLSEDGEGAGVLTLTLVNGQLVLHDDGVQTVIDPLLEPLIIDGGPGNDTLTLDFSNGNPLPGRALRFNGGDGADQDGIVLTGGAAVSVIHTSLKQHDGSIDIDGSTINYTGVDIVTDNLIATERVFTFDGGAETITLQDATDVNMMIDSTLSAPVTFANPTGSLTVNAGTGDDTVTIASVDADGPFDVDLTINGDGGSDIIQLNADITFAAGKNLDVDLTDDSILGDVDQINIAANVNLALSGTGRALLQASGSIVVANGSSIGTENGEIRLEANQQSTPTAGDPSGVEISDAMIESTGTGDITLIGDDIAIAGTTAIVASGGSVTLRQQTAGTEIDLGTDTAGKLSLTDRALDRITAGTINIGDGDTGPITVSAAISRDTTTALNLQSAAAINFTGGSLNSSGGDVMLAPGVSVSPTSSGTDVTADSLAFGPGADLKIAINGTTIDTEYESLNVAGNLRLQDVELDLVSGGGFTPQAGQMFTIVNNDGDDEIRGKFTGLPEQALITNFLGSGLNARITYYGGDGNDVDLLVATPVEENCEDSYPRRCALGELDAFVESLPNAPNYNRHRTEWNDLSNKAMALPSDPDDEALLALDGRIADLRARVGCEDANFHIRHCSITGLEASAMIRRPERAELLEEVLDLHAKAPANIIDVEVNLLDAEIKTIRTDIYCVAPEDSNYPRYCAILRLGEYLSEFNVDMTEFDSLKRTASRVTPPGTPEELQAIDDGIETVKKNGTIAALESSRNTFASDCANTNPRPPDCDATLARYDELFAALQAPALTTQTVVSVAESQRVVINLEATDDNDSEGNGLTYGLTGGADRDQFSVDTDTGNLTLNVDFERPADANLDNVYEVEVTVSDSGNATDVETLKITVTDVNEPPRIRLSSPASILDDHLDTSSAIKVSDIEIVDDALGNNELNLYGADADLFEIGSGSLFLKAGVGLDFLAQPRFDVTVAVDDPSVGNSLDDRRAVAVLVRYTDNFVVDNVSDVSDGNYGPGQMSLRETIDLTNANPGGDMITFAPALTAGGRATITLGGTELAITDAVTITGPGANLLTIDANQQSRIFRVDNGNDDSEIDVSLSGLTLTRGHATDGDDDTNSPSDNGGAILSRENLTLTDSTIAANSTTDGGAAGGIFNDGTLTVTNSSLTGNTASFGSGMFNTGEGALAITSSTLSGSMAKLGGGIFNGGGTLTVSNSTISGNTAAQGPGGGIVNGGTLTIANSTLSGNTAQTDGGGIFNSSGGTLTVTNSIVAGNRLTAGGNSDIAGSVESASRSNLLGVDTDLSGITHDADGNQIGTSTSPIDPLLGPLADNGGLTQTHALLPGSPALDAGSSSLLPADMADVDHDQDTDEPLPQDSRGATRVIGGALDIGAFESASKFFDDGTFALFVNGPPGFQEPPAPFQHNATDAKTIPGDLTIPVVQVVEVFDSVPNAEPASFPLTFVDQVASTFGRITYQKANGTTGALGTSFIATAAFWPAVGEFDPIPDVASASVKTDGLDRYVSTAIGTFGTRMKVTSTKTFGDPVVGETQVDVNVKAEVLEQIIVGGTSNSDAFRFLTLSSMFASETVFDANMIRYADPAGMIHVLTLDNQTQRDAHLLPAGTELGAWLELVKNDGSTWHPDSPTIRVDITDAGNQSLAIQGFQAATTDPNDDSLNVWVERISPDTTIEPGTLELSFTITATEKAGDLALTQTVDNASPTLGEEVTFTLTLTNSGPFDATNVIVGNQLPAGWAFVSADSQDFNSTTGHWNVGSIANGATATLQITARANSAGAQISMAEVVSADQVDPDSTPNNSNTAEDDSASIGFNIMKADPVINWNNPDDITFGTLLDDTQLNATTDVAGSFAYDPASGTMLNAGANQQLGVTFTPADTTNYNNATANVSINVLKADPVITWNTPADITFGTLLDDTQLSATADVAGLFDYDPAADTQLNAGANQQLGVTFTPTDTTNYNNATANVAFDVLKADPVITWNTPADITFGTLLDDTQLNATANVDGSFDYDPAGGTMLNAGANQQLGLTFTPTDAANYNNATADVAINVLRPDLDYGDAPAVYPVTFAQDGARHTASALRLGSLIDVEADGQPDNEAGQDGTGGDDNDGDADEDGVFVIASMVATSATSTTSSFAVTASQAGQVDAWVDFNQNGTWEHPAEQIFTSEDVAAGLNILHFTVPAGATAGDTGARFRISSAGGLAPTGAASDGEVEDYIVRILNGDAAEAAAVQIQAPTSGTMEVVAGSGTVIVRTRDPDHAIFVAPVDSVSTLSIRGTGGDDILNLEDIPSVEVSGDAHGGNNTLNLLGSGFSLDLTMIPDTALQGIETINITGDGDNSLTLDAAEVLNISSTTDTLRVKSDAGDMVNIGADWTFHGTLVDSGDFIRVLMQGDATLQLDSPFDWSYPENSLDANHTGSVEALDALVIINELNDRKFSNPDGSLLDPTTLDEFPNFFYDASPDGFVTAIDALVIINRLNEAASSAEGEAANMAGLYVAGQRDDDALHSPRQVAKTEQPGLTTEPAAFIGSTAATSELGYLLARRNDLQSTETLADLFAELEWLLE